VTHCFRVAGPLTEPSILRRSGGGTFTARLTVPLLPSRRPVDRPPSDSSVPVLGPASGGHGAAFKFHES
jgi:hypothetical protein